MMRSRFFIVGVVLAVVGVIALGTFWYNRPTQLTFVIGPPGTEPVKLADALRVGLARERSSVRLRIVPIDNPTDGAARLTAGEAQLAVVRADLAMPSSATVVAVWQRNPVVLVATAASEIERWTDLSGKTLGVLGRRIGVNNRLVETILHEHGVQPSSVRIVELDPWDVSDTVKRGLIHAMVTVGPVSARPIAEAIAAFFREAPEGQAKLIPVREAEAIGNRVAFLETINIPAGSFGLNPPRPSEALPTLGVATYLVALRSVPDAAIGELTEQIFALRPNLVAQHPIAQRLEVPDTEKGAAVPVHPGALAYLTGEQKSFLDRYSDLLYLSIFGVSLLGSMLAGAASYFGFGRREEDTERLGDVLDLLRQARAARGAEELDAIARRSDDIFVEAIGTSARGAIDQSRFDRLNLALDHLSAVIADRRRSLALLRPDAPGAIELVPGESSGNIPQAALRRPDRT